MKTWSTALLAAAVALGGCGRERTVETLDGADTVGAPGTTTGTSTGTATGAPIDTTSLAPPDTGAAGRP
jgi:hypothetical protein